MTNQRTDNGPTGGDPPAGVLQPAGHGMWIPLLAVITVLAVLAIAPIIVSVNVRRLRSRVTDVIDPARLRTTELAASLAQQMLAVGMHRESSTSTGAADYRDARRVEQQDALALDSLLRFGEPDAVELFGQYREAATRWHDDAEEILQHPSTGASLDTARSDGLAALAAARHLGERLAEVSAEVRVRVQRAERLDVYLPLGLVPLALFACVLVVRGGRRTMAMADRADRDRVVLRRIMEQKTAFIRGFTHDLQNPLGAALGYIELMLEGIMSPAAERETLQSVRRLVATSIETVSGLLAVARSERGEVRLAPTTIDLRAIGKAAVDDHSLLAASRRQSLTFSDAPSCHAVGDAGRVRHIIDNLLSNAMKYTPEGGRIRVTVACRRTKDRLWSTLSVHDSGPGIPEDWREKIFEEFARVPAAREAVAGHGIGLTMSRRIARLMGGDVTLETEAPLTPDGVTLGGATLTLWLSAPSQDETRTPELSTSPVRPHQPESPRT